MMRSYNNHAQELVLARCNESSNDHVEEIDTKVAECRYDEPCGAFQLHYYLP